MSSCWDSFKSILFCYWDIQQILQEINVKKGNFPRGSSKYSFWTDAQIVKFLCFSKLLNSSLFQTVNFDMFFSHIDEKVDSISFHDFFFEKNLNFVTKMAPYNKYSMMNLRLTVSTVILWKTFLIAFKLCISRSFNKLIGSMNILVKWLS